MGYKIIDNRKENEGFDFGDLNSGEFFKRHSKNGGLYMKCTDLPAHACEYNCVQFDENFFPMFMTIYWNEKVFPVEVVISVEKDICNKEELK